MTRRSSLKFMTKLSCRKFGRAYSADFRCNKGLTAGRGLAIMIARLKRHISSRPFGLLPCRSSSQLMYIISSPLQVTALLLLHKYFRKCSLSIHEFCSIPLFKQSRLAFLPSHSLILCKIRFKYLSGCLLFDPSWLCTKIVRLVMVTCPSQCKDLSMRLASFWMEAFSNHLLSGTTTSWCATGLTHSWQKNVSCSGWQLMSTA